MGRGPCSAMRDLPRGFSFNVFCEDPSHDPRALGDVSSRHARIRMRQNELDRYRPLSQTVRSSPRIRGKGQPDPLWKERAEVRSKSGRISLCASSAACLGRSHRFRVNGLLVILPSRSTCKRPSHFGKLNLDVGLSFGAPDASSNGCKVVLICRFRICSRHAKQRCEANLDVEDSDRDQRAIGRSGEEYRGVPSERAVSASTRSSIALPDFKDCL